MQTNLQATRLVIYPNKNMFRSIREKLVTYRDPVIVWFIRGRYMQTTLAYAEANNMRVRYGKYELCIINPHGPFRKTRNRQVKGGAVELARQEWKSSLK